MAARATLAVASFVLFAAVWLLLDSGTVDGFVAQAAGASEGDGTALRGVRRLTGSGDSGTTQIRERNSLGPLASAVWQLIYGAIYFFVIVKNYPELQGGPTEKAKETQSKNELMAFFTCENSFVINLTSCCCPAGRAAHTYDKDAQALDDCTGVAVGLCGVEQGDGNSEDSE